MKKFNRKLSLISLLSLLLPSCNSGGKTVSLFIYDDNDVFINSFKNEIIVSLLDKGYQYLSHDAQLSQITQNEQIVEDMDNHVSEAYIINPMDRISAGAIIEKANTYDYPVIFFNREPLSEDMNEGRNENKNLFYVGTNPIFEGKTQADMLMDLFGNPDALNPEYDKNQDGVIQLLMLKGEISHQDTEKRTQGVLNEFKDKGYQVNVVESVYCNWSKELTIKNMPNIMRDYGEQIEVVVSNNDNMALGVIQYLKDQYENEQKTKEGAKSSSTEEFKMPFPIVGVDGIEESIEAIQAGYLYGTVKNNEKKQAETITTLVQYVLGDRNSIPDLTPDAENEYAYYIEGEKITKQNLEQKS